MIKKIVVGVIAFVLIILVVTSRPVTKIKSSERGIVYKRWAVQSIVLKEWIHITMPFSTEVDVISVTPQAMDVSVPVWSEWAITKDNQTIWANLTLFYRFDENTLIDMAKNYWQAAVKDKLYRDTMEAFKQTIGQYTIFDVASNQEKIRQEVIVAFQKKIWNYPATFVDLKLSNFDRSDAFDAQIAETMQIAQQAKQKEQEVKVTELEAQKIVKQAEANKQAEALNADAMALKWEGIKKYNEAITANPKNMELEIRLKELEIEKMKVEKWNWQYVSQNNYGPIPVDVGWILWK